MCLLEAHTIQRLLDLCHSFSSGRSFLSGPRIFKRSSFLSLEVEVVGVESLEEGFKVDKEGFNELELEEDILEVLEDVTKVVFSLRHSLSQHSQ